MTRKIVLTLVLAVVAALAFWIYKVKSEPPGIGFAAATRETLVDTLITNGRAEPVEWVAVRSETEGTVQRVAVQLGQSVPKGAVLVQLDATAASADLSAAEARIAQARAELATIKAGGRASDIAEIEGSLAKARLELQAAQREAASLQRLIDQKAATPYEMLAVKDRIAQAQAQIAALEQRKAALVPKTDLGVTQARLRDAEVAADLARRRAAQGTITSPIAGVVYSLDARVGAFLKPGDVVASVGKVERMRVLVYVDEPELGRVRAGMPVVITWDARPGQQWTGTVEKVPTEIITLGTRQVGEVVCIVDNPGHELLPGTNVNASIRSQVVENALTIPKEALRRQNDQSGVLLLEGDRLVWRPVKLGVSSMTRIQVLEGLKEGDRVALPTDKPIKSGDKVQPLATEQAR